MLKNNCVIHTGLGILQHLKIATFLFSQLTKFGILIKTRVKSLAELEKLDNVVLGNYKFLLTDCCINAPLEWKKYMGMLPKTKFVLLYDNSNANNLKILQSLGFVFIQFNAFSVSIIANQILNVMNSIYSERALELNNSRLKFQEKRLETIRVTLTNQEFFIFTKLSNLAFLQYKDFSIKLSELEANIMYDLVSAYKWASHSLVKFPLLSYRQVTNTISRLRNKLKLIDFPLVIKNDYARGYFLQKES